MKNQPLVTASSRLKNARHHRPGGALAGITVAAPRAGDRRGIEILTLKPASLCVKKTLEPV